MKFGVAFLFAASLTLALPLDEVSSDGFAMQQATSDTQGFVEFLKKQEQQQQEQQQQEQQEQQ
ncbi:hypothetical protein MGG_17687 [Pyricularia oryzae 70-15]|uniref:Uncharacterized protein n=3 Tax=Pyricularia oryzae TaxID=318829 RepID=G4NGK3_PYRO7|nr:uncharacterized protein MGG_17687 [Pyricularia oryzae 70-15]EHA47363.1 hypothetical protein MGG_17687 [Pyricularia oryzae 70-15]ELQ41768.1 hypothetical protein OOU_Y34scaffold00255g66 [Pyricularia oryzae Y34]